MRERWLRLEEGVREVELEEVGEFLWEEERFDSAAVVAC